jgi:hypothetical protein
VLTEIAKVSGIDRQITGKGPTQRLVGGDQGAQPLVDLAIHTLPALLNRDHCKQADADADQRNDRQAQQGGDEGMQRAEIETAQLDPRKELHRMKRRPSSKIARTCRCNERSGGQLIFRASSQQRAA